MTNNRIRPINNGPRPTGRPVQPQQPTGRPAPQQAPVQQPVQPQVQSAPVQQPMPTQQMQQKPPTHSYEETQNNSGRQEYPEQRFGGMPPNLGFEESYEEGESSRKKSNKLKMAILGVVGIVVIAAIAFLLMQVIGNDDSKVDQGALGNSNNELNITSLGGSNSGNKFDGNPIPVKWPSDVTPTRMEIQLDPVTGNPILMLIGDKSGLGTVVRSYAKDGSLSGYWVIVPDDASATNAQPNTNNQQSNQSTDNNQNANTENNAGEQNNETNSDDSE